jgi:hypothetical protein
MFLGSWVEVGMASVYQTATSNVVDESYLWLVPAACRAQGGRLGSLLSDKLCGERDGSSLAALAKKA